jgi:hypothetical protein
MFHARMAGLLASLMAVAVNVGREIAFEHIQERPPSRTSGPLRVSGGSAREMAPCMPTMTLEACSQILNSPAK